MMMSDPRKSPNENLARIRREQAALLLERNRGKPQYRHAPNVGVSSRKILRPLSKKFGAGRNVLADHWPQIVGDKWAALSAPSRLHGTKEQKTLTITAKGPAASLILAKSSQFLSQINEFLGHDSVHKIIVKQGIVKARTHKSTPPPLSSPQTSPSNPKAQGTIQEKIQGKSAAAQLQSSLEPLGGDQLQQALGVLQKSVSKKSGPHKKPSETP